MLIMARDGLSAFLCAGLLCATLSVAILPSASAAPPEERDNPITSTLAVQTALQQGREQLLRGNTQTAVSTLEAQLARINGSREYLTVLRDAYRAYIKELRLAGKEADAEEYLKRLRILDPAAILDGSVARGANAPATPTKAAGPDPVKQPATARGKIDDDPFRPENVAVRATAAPGTPTVLDRAEAEFANRNYPAAARFFEQAYQADPNFGSGTRERWAYCKLYQVVQQMNQPAGSLNGPDLEREVRLALCLAPRLEEYGKDLLRKVQERQGGTLPVAPDRAATAGPVAVHHQERQADGWAVTETANFRIRHNQPRDLAEKVAQVVEATRTTMARKWLGEVGDDWTPRCDIFLHPNAQDYSRATGQRSNSPGHSTIHSDAGRVVGRRVDVHCDDPTMLTVVLPHETTHVVLAGKFGEYLVPRWADEGIAMLSEPSDRIERYERGLTQLRQEQQLLSIRQLMMMNDYPEAKAISAFYAQSVSLVDFLAREKGPQTVTAFLREGLRTGYEPALKRHYGIADFNELEQRWRRFALGEAVPNGVADRGR
jgi:tetratricopeptide (TPR) repeat protein